MDITEFRQKYPQYNDMSDDDLTTSFHTKYYSDIPFQEFRAKFGIKPSLWERVSGTVKSPVTGALEQAAALPEDAAITRRAEGYRALEGGNEYQYNPYGLRAVGSVVGVQLPGLSSPQERQEFKEEIKTPLEQAPSYKLGAGLRGMAPEMHPEVKQSVPVQIGKTFGQAGVQLGASAIPYVGLGVTASMANASESAEMYRRARAGLAKMRQEQGLPEDNQEDERLAVYAAKEAAPLGLFDSAGSMALLAATKGIGGIGKVQGLTKRLVEIAAKYPRTATGIAGAAEEAATEIPQDFFENEIAKKYWGEQANEMESAAAAGGIAGTSGLILGILAKALRLKIKGKSTAQATTAEDFAQAPVEQETGGYSDAEVERQFQESKAKVQDWQPPTQPANMEGFGVQPVEEVIPRPTESRPSPIPRSVPIPTGPETRTTGPRTEVLPAAPIPHVDMTAQAKKDSLPSLPTSPVQDLLQERFQDRTIAEHTAEQATQEYGRRFHVWPTEHGYSLRLAPQGSLLERALERSVRSSNEAKTAPEFITRADGEVVRQKDVDMSLVEQMRRDLAARKGEQNAQTIRSNEGQVQIPGIGRQEGQGEGRQDIQQQAPIETSNQEEARLVRSSNAPVSDERLMRSYKTKLSAGRDTGALRKVYPDRKFEVKERDGKFYIREKMGVQLGMKPAQTAPKPALGRFNKEVGQQRDLSKYSDEVSRGAQDLEMEDVYNTPQADPAVRDAKRMATALLAQATEDLQKAKGIEKIQAVRWFEDQTSDDPGSYKWTADTLSTEEVPFDMDAMYEAVKSGQAKPEKMRDTIKLFSLDPIGMMNEFGKEMDKLPGGGFLTRLGSSYNKRFALPHWVAKVKDVYSDFYHKSRQISVAHEEKLKRSLEGLDALFQLPVDSQRAVVKKLWEIENKKLKTTPSPEFNFTADAQGKRQVEANEKFYGELEGWLKSKGMNEAETKAFMDIRKSLHQDFVERFNWLAKRPNVDQMVLEDMYQYVGKVDNYLPHNWYGDHYVEGMNEKGEVVARLPVDMKWFNKTLGKSGKFRQMIKQFEAKNGNTQLTWSDPKAASELEKFYINTPVSVDVIGRVLDEAIGKFAGKPEYKSVVEQIRKALPEEVSSILKSRGFSNFAKRKGMLGYEQNDLLRVLADYKVGAYGSLRRMEQARAFADVMLKKKPNSEDTKILNQYFEDMMAPQGRLEDFVGNVRMLLYARYMGGRIKPAIVNLSNQITTGIPMLSMYAKDSAIEHTKALKDITTQWGREVVEKRKTIGIYGKKNGKNHLKSEELTLLKQLQDEGVTNPQMVWEMVNQIKRNYSQQGAMSRLTSMVFGGAKEILAAPMEMTEWYSRAATALASARAMANGKLVQLWNPIPKVHFESLVAQPASFPPAK